MVVRRAREGHAGCMGGSSSNGVTLGQAARPVGSATREDSPHCPRSGA